MIPKDKAEALVNQFRMVLMDEDTECGNELLCTSIAIKNSLITVDEILEGFIERLTPYQLKYWLEVKQELKKL